jgi:hypothetical protein
MAAANQPQNGAIQHWVVVRPDPPGQYTARAAGLPDVAATAATRDEALHRVQELLSALLASGQLVPLEVRPANPLLQAFGRTDANDPHEQAYLEELARVRQEDLERTLRELDQPCSNSSSTQTT